MSHHTERKEKNCLNCGTLVQGRYCHICGQENIEPKEGFWDLVKHFFYDITHFDGKLFHSLKYLLTRPGFLPKEYVLGRRASYLNPIRMYVFTSAFFFLLFFSFLHSENPSVTIDTINGKSLDQINQMDSAGFAHFTANINKEDDKPAVPMTRKEFESYKDSAATHNGIHFTSHRYASKEQYDSLLKAGVKKHNWLERQFIYKEIEINKTYHNDTKQIIKAFSSTLLHTLPQILFISLPLMALLLQLLYIRRKKEFYYISHAIFSIYFYIFMFLAFLVIASLAKINSYADSGVLSFLIALSILGIFVYQYVALRKFYRQGWFKTLMKFFILNFLFGIVVSILFAIFTLFSLFKI